VNVRVTVNGEAHERDVQPRRQLVDFLRHDLGLHVTHTGCAPGGRGMCTVLFDGEALKSCLMLAPQADGHEITTVESLAPGDDLHPLQEAFRQEHGLQCGYCTPAFLLAALAIERRGQRLEGEELRTELAGTLCRCTGYQHVVAAVERYFRERAEAAVP